ncbi:hypothetical protein [Streptomyces sp. VNUA24]|uniref:hypothetical protein n=1 Tax=Streptomyces sp. VNUA24 TaxID=3031131 RepID=UPI0023B8253E|nr:hypothetical protein [Streptomyces sp. VNUA24]WEH18561.1 hypothetical protein PYR72_34770 [Streptomyces sp. VNUA24]
MSRVLGVPSPRRPREVRPVRTGGRSPGPRRQDGRPRSGGFPSYGRGALLTTAVTALALTASGCVVVRGDLEVVPTTTQGEAARALKDFTTAYNKADKAYDQSQDASRVTGALADIDGGKLRSGAKLHPGGNPDHVALKLTDVTYTIPKKAGWPRWFVADADANKGNKTDRWLFVFTRDGLTDLWEVSFLTVVPRADLPEFKKDENGYARAVTPDDPELSVAPAELPEKYVTYLREDSALFADGPYTSEKRSERRRNATKPGLARQFIDEALTNGDYAPVGLRTTDGGALVFFTTRHYQKQTAAQGVSIPVRDSAVRALMTGEPKQSLTLEFVNNQAVLDPAKTNSEQPVKFLSQVGGLTGAKGE